MKKALLLVLAGIFLAGFVSAQQRRGHNWGPNPGTPAQTITVTGTLQLQNGSIAVANGDTVYYIPVLERYIGFIDGLKEGAPVNVEGYVFHNRAYAYLRPSKVTLDGKSYDFPSNNFVLDSRNGYGRNHPQRRGGWHRW
jgi:hypothetical protein